MSFYYTAYGLTICSEFQLPEFTSIKDADPDVIIYCSSLKHLNNNNISNNEYFTINHKVASLHWIPLGYALIKNGQEILLDLISEVDYQFLGYAIIGPIFTALLYQRGFLLLHASAVDVNGKIIAFLGNKGYGKSTIAASFCTRGYKLIADDVIAIDFNQDQLVAWPCSIKLKLWPDTIMSVLNMSLEDYNKNCPRLYSTTEKRACHVMRKLEQKAIPIHSIYILGVGPEIVIAPLSMQDAFVEIMRNNYIVLLDHKSMEGQEGVLNFHKCSKLLNRMKVFSLDRPAELEMVSKVTHQVENHQLHLEALDDIHTC